MSIRSTVPDGATVYDIPAARAARAEARSAAGEANPFIKLSSGFVEVKPEFDITVAMDFANNDLRAGLQKLLVDPDDIEPLLADGLTTGDLTGITKFITGSDLGE